jgi:hypothetical protein
MTEDQLVRWLYVLLAAMAGGTAGVLLLWALELPGLTLKRARIERDYDVLADGKVVGRIYEDASASTPPQLRWLWSITAIVPAIAGRDERHCRDARRG